jgi:hypothetical protein
MRSSDHGRKLEEAKTPYLSDAVSSLDIDLTGEEIAQLGHPYVALRLIRRIRRCGTLGAS